jgi:hypothetical protein
MVSRGDRSRTHKDLKAWPDQIDPATSPTVTFYARISRAEAASFAPPDEPALAVWDPPDVICEMMTPCALVTVVVVDPFALIVVEVVSVPELEDEPPDPLALDDDEDEVAAEDEVRDIGLMDIRRTPQLNATGNGPEITR